MYELYFKQSLSNTQVQTLKILVWLIKEPWYLLINLDNLDEVLKIHRSRMGIEAMFKDCKTWGYNLEVSRANTQPLTNFILLIAIDYTAF